VTPLGWLSALYLNRCSVELTCTRVSQNCNTCEELNIGCALCLVSRYIIAVPCETSEDALLSKHDERHML